MIAIAVYVLGTLVCLLCAVFLLTAYLRVQNRLLLWSGICFVGLTCSNALVFIDLVVLPKIDLYTYRLAIAAIAMLFLVYGLIFETK